MQFQKDEKQMEFSFEMESSPKSQVLTVSEFTKNLRNCLEKEFYDVWVKGEISNYKVSGQGHAFFTLKDKLASLSVVIYRNGRSKFKFKIEDGLEVIVHGKITVYDPRGSYQLICDDMEPVGIGALILAFNQLKEKLQKEGLFDASHKKPLPLLPKRIGVITSTTGAAIQDILKVLNNRFSNREIIIIPTSVQGEKAAGEIVAAIKMAERWNIENETNKIDVLIIGRGGGSLEDLWPFNEEIVARAIYDCPIPTISAVGHQIDFTISDFVADRRAETPSAAAEIVIPRKSELLRNIDTFFSRLKQAFFKNIEKYRLHLAHLSQRLVDPRKKLTIIMEQILRERLRLVTSMKAYLRQLNIRLENIIHKLELLSPLKIISRGYSITSLQNGEIMRSIKQVSEKDRIFIRVVDGTILSEVLSIESEKE